METPEWQETNIPFLKVLETPDLPGEDGEPMENERERIQISLGIESLDNYWKDRNDFYIGGNMFVYYSLSQAQAVTEELKTPGLPKKAFRGPDMFVVLGVDGSYRRQKWVVWEEKGKYPSVIFEFLSPSTRMKDLTEKKRLYEQTFCTREYFCFDYLSPEKYGSLSGWRLDNRGQYKAIAPDNRGWLWSEELNLWVGGWSGSILRDDTVWMRFYTPEGELVMTSGEQEAQRAEQEAQKAERLAAQLRSAGIEPDI
ncbi:MAG: Uma2 family endonuclease [Desulfobacteraceae bacterium]|nr:Uma2 family endonuclease [Desulfobacteraceae bacterium]